MFKFLFSAAQPDIEQLKRKRNVAGLIKALGYSKKRYKQYISGPKTNERFREFEIDASQALIGAALALAEIGAPRGARPIIEAFTDVICTFGDWRQAHDPYNFASVTLSRFGAAAVEPLIELITHHQGSDADWAQMALGWIGDERATVPLIGAFRGESTIWALGHIGGREASRFLVNALLGTDLQKLYPNPNRTYRIERHDRDVILYALGSGKFDSDNNAADILADALVTSLTRKDHLGRIQPDTHISEALCQMNDARGLEIMLKILQDSEFSHVRPSVACVFAMARCKDDRARQFLVSAVEKYTDSRLRTVDPTKELLDKTIFSALALARIGDVRAIKPLVDLLGNQEKYNLRDREVLSALRDTHYYPGINSYYNVAVRALIDLGAAALEPLSKYLADPDPNVSSRVNKVLVAING